MSDAAEELKAEREAFPNNKSSSEKNENQLGFPLKQQYEDSELEKTIDNKNALDLMHEKEQERNYLLVIKLILYSTQIIVVHLLVLWYFPYLGNFKFQQNSYLQGLYALYLISMVFESQQIRYGLPSFTKVSFPLMRKPTAFSSFAFKVYRGAPFLFELRTMMD